MIAYPTNFPQPGTSLSGDASTPTARTDIETGLIYQEGRFSTGLETFRAQWTLSEAELVVFEEWFSETLAGGVLVFGLLLPDDGAYSLQPVRFVGGNYEVSHKGGLWWNVNATLEQLTLRNAPSNRTPSIPQFLRLAVDEALSQVLTLSHRNALLTVRPTEGNTTTLRIFPPNDPTAYIYFGIDNQGDGETLITSQDADPIIPESIQAFPLDLPNVNTSFNLRAERRTFRAEMDSGHVRQFAASKATRKTYQVEWEFSLEELQTFQDFFFVTLRSGAKTFTLTLPVDGLFVAVPVRFIGGKYSESYVPTDRFKVSASIERIVDQTVAPSEAQPFPVYYAPTVYVTANRKSLDAQGKFFVVNPSAGQTISLHIYGTNPQFGLLVVGPGNVLITRGPYILDLGTFTDGAGGVFAPPTFELVDASRDLGTLDADFASGSFTKPTFELRETTRDLGTLAGDTAGGAFLKPSLELIEILVDLGTLAGDAAQGSFTKPTFELVIP